MMDDGTTNTPAVAQVLAEWLSGLGPERIPEAVRDAVIDSVIDTTGLSVAARGTDYIAALTDAWDGDGPCTALGHGGGHDAAGAAMINGTAAHGEDFDNTFEGCPVHSGTVIVPAVLAAAERHGLDGGRVLAGMAAGIEVMCRLGLVSGKGVHSAGFHPTAVLGTLGATAAVGVALGLGPRQLTNALGVAGSMASGIIEYLADGSWTKRMHAGWAAQSGIHAALMGRAGFTGPATVFEGTHGFFSGFAQSITPDFGHLTNDLGQVWQTENLAFKPYACGTMAQPFVDCAVQLAAQLAKEDIKADDIATMVCEVGEGTVHRLWEPMALKHRPPTPYGAKFSSPYCIAVGFLDGDAGLGQFTDARIQDPAVQSLAAKISYVIDPDDEYPANYTGHVRATLKDGTVHEVRQPHLRGGAHEKISRSDLIRKFHANVAFGGWPEDLANRLLEFSQTLPQCADVSALGTFRV